MPGFKLRADICPDHTETPRLADMQKDVNEACVQVRLLGQPEAWARGPRSRMHEGIPGWFHMFPLADPPCGPRQDPAKTRANEKLAVSDFM